MRPAIALAVAIAILGVSCGETTTDGGPRLPDDRLALPEYGAEGYRTIIKGLRGKPTVVNFWGSWCPPCRFEAPHLADISREFEGRINFFGVNFRDARQSAREFILEFDWPFPSIFDPDYEILPALGYIGWPVTLVYDAEGRITYERVGAIDPEALRREIRKALEAAA
jgi:cytochrome c biogenesis protein CcmG/thiol:disulfide interchange protein DsbE